MKLLVDASFHTGIKVGIARYIERIVPELAKFCNVTVLTSSPEVFAQINCRVINIPKWTQTHRGRIIWELTSLSYYCRSDYDLLLCTTPIVPPFCPIPVISVVHDLTPLVQHKYHSSKYKTAFLISIKTLAWADAAISDSLYTRKEVLKYRLIPPKKIKVVYSGPGVQPYNHDCGFGGQFKPYVLYVGGHIPTKNVVRLIAAFSKLKSVPKMKLVLVGWGKPHHIEKTKQAIVNHGVEERVILLPSISDPELSSLYANCSGFVFPSLYEGFGLPVLEAMAHGIPVACSYSSSLPEIAGDAAVYFDPLNVLDIKHAIELLLYEPLIARQLGENGRTRSRIFSWTNAARDIYELACSIMRR